MTRGDQPVDRPLEETPEAEAAVEDETTVPQLITDGEDRSAFRDVGDQPVDFPPTDNLIGDAHGAGSGGPGIARTGAEQPWDPEDLTVAKGCDPTPGNVERARRELEREGRAAVEKTVP